MNIQKTIKKHAEKIPDAPSIIGSDGAPLSYKQLYKHLFYVKEKLSEIGIRRNDRIAVVIPNGPEMAVAFLSVAAYTTCEPLNPEYRVDEFDFYFSNLNPTALLIPAGVNSPALGVANKYDIPVIELIPSKKVAGIFTLHCDRTTEKVDQGFAEADDIALIFHTSGTTSRPKIVPLTQTNICISAWNVQNVLKLTPDDRALNVMPLFHIVGLVGVLLSSIRAGASVICASGFDVTKFFDFLQKLQPTWYSAVPTVHQAILLRAKKHLDIINNCSIRLIRSASAPLHPNIIVELENIFDVPVIEAYGLTEVFQITSNPLPPGQRKIGSVGMTAGPEFAIMDDAGNLLKDGDIGEIVAKGKNLMSGYKNNPEENERSFTNGWFRTGDQGYKDNDGYLFITGRLKEIINRGGEKFSPRETDEVLLEHPAVKQAVTFAVPHVQLGEDVAAAVVLKEKNSVSERGIQEFISKHLADFKIPRQIIFLDEIPKGPSGKLQRIGLAKKFRITGEYFPLDHKKAEFVAPGTEIERKLTEIWQELLCLKRVGVNNNFFYVGGSSLIATQMISRIREIFNVEILVVELFHYPTIAGIAKVIESAQKREEISKYPDIGTISRDGNIPLSFTQKRLWFLDQLEGPSPTYNIARALKITGLLNIKALEDALNEIIERHEALRTNFMTVDNNPVQNVNSKTGFKVKLIDVTSPNAEEYEQKIQQLAKKEAEKSFDLKEDQLIRVTLLRINSHHHVLLLTIHHIISDGWSIGIFFHELKILYSAFLRGKPLSLAALPVQYADFSHWQREWLQGAVLEEQIAYWKKQIAGAPALLALPTDKPRPAVQTFKGSNLNFKLDSDLTKKLKSLAQKTGTTLFILIESTFAVLLSRYSSQNDILIGIPIANRRNLKIENLIGFFANILVMRHDLSEDLKFSKFLAKAKQTALGAYAHQDLPIEKLIDELNLERQLSYSPLFQVMFVWHNTPQVNPKLDELTLEFLPRNSTIARFDLTLSMEEIEKASKEAQNEIQGFFEYNTALFNHETIERMLDHFKTILYGIVANPEDKVSELPMLTEKEKHRMLVEWNNTKTDYPKDKCIHELFEEQVERTPDSIAVVFEDQSLTYKELNSKANQLAHYLRKLGVKPETLVGIFVERSLEMTVGLLGILKAGGAYIPLDPEYPKERLEFIIEDTQAPILLTQEKFINTLPQQQTKIICLDKDWGIIEKEDSEYPAFTVEPNNLCYVIYTSGSTGRPKGVMNIHKALCNLFFWMQDTYRLTSNDAMLQKIPFSFDVATSEILWPILNGARVVFPKPEGHKDISYLISLIKKQKITILNFVPPMLKIFLEDKDVKTSTSIRQVNCGGESLPSELQNQFFDSLDAELHNQYGPTEAAITTSFWQCRKDSKFQLAPIGVPISNTQLYILDKFLSPVPIGVFGELHIGGMNLARGYHKRPDLTAERFIPNPFSKDPESRLYKTGDLGRWLIDGNIEFLGRVDHQVKVRGFRIELGEIEATLTEHPGIKNAAVLAREEQLGSKQLVAYLVPTTEQGSSVHELRGFLNRKLPDYMIPATFVFLEKLPLNPNGKVDRKALPAPDFHVTREHEFVTPRNETEKAISEIWKEVLGIEKVSIYDNFFEIGGNSLLTVRLVAKIGQQLEKTLPVSKIFEYPTIEKLSRILDKKNEEFSFTPLVKFKTKGKSNPLFFIHYGNGEVFHFMDLVHELENTEIPLYGLRSYGLEPNTTPFDSIEIIAEKYIEAIRTVQPEGPYRIVGHCFGGAVAYEMVQQLKQEGEKIEFLAVINSPAPPQPSPKGDVELFITLFWGIGGVFQKDILHFFCKRQSIDVGKGYFALTENIQSLTKKERLEIFLKSGQDAGIPFEDADIAYLNRSYNVINNHTLAASKYIPKPYEDRFIVFSAEQNNVLLRQKDEQPTLMCFRRSPGYEKKSPLSENPDSLYWEKYCNNLIIHKTPGSHFSMLRKPHVKSLGDKIKRNIK
uniref:Amino acid adenylation domain-containing protein n=1 Tax=Candidatus Kentrum sp. FW TaxID=2126338 RepID=A0A450TSU1_9GAMM|nr:MAG: amino acid adenylation domain-containing protein [Candidatus Kentron sp. FW]